MENCKKCACKHNVKKEGVAFYPQENKDFMFSPNQAEPNEVSSFRIRGVAMQMSDGTFCFEAKPHSDHHSTLLLKLAHGRLSKTKDGKVQLTLKFDPDEEICISAELRNEAILASDKLYHDKL